MFATKAIVQVIAYLVVGYFIAKWMGGDRSHLSPDVTYMDWLGMILIMLVWPLIPIFAFVRWVRGF